MNVDHATGLCGGIGRAERRERPAAASRAKFGIRPRAIRSRVSS